MIPNGCLCLLVVLDILNGSWWFLMVLCCSCWFLVGLVSSLCFCGSCWFLVVIVFFLLFLG